MNNKKQMVSPKTHNAYHTQPRPFLSYRKPPATLPEEVTDPVIIWSRIEAFIFDQDQARFLPSQRALKIASLTPKTPAGDIGFLVRDFKLSELRKLLGRAEKSEAEDVDILSCLDKLSLAFRLKIISAAIKKFSHVSNISFTAEIAVCVNEVRQSSGWVYPKNFDVHFYLNEPLDQRNFLWGDRTILVPSERVAKLRERRDLQFEKVF